MRINKFIAFHTGYSRRSADELIKQGKVLVNGKIPEPGVDITADDVVSVGGDTVDSAKSTKITLMLHKPPGYVCSRDGQGSRTIYDLLPKEYARLKYIGRLDKDSTGLLLLTTDGELINNLTHPSRHKVKVYEVRLDKNLEPLHHQMISDNGINLEDGVSRFQIEKINPSGNLLKITMTEGRNRQIRRTFSALGYDVIGLHRTNFGEYSLGSLGVGKYSVMD